MARLKLVVWEVEIVIIQWLTDRIRDDAIETRISSGHDCQGREKGLPIGFAMARLKPEAFASKFCRNVGLPIGFAMARLKRRSESDRNPRVSGLTDRIRDGAIETSVFSHTDGTGTTAYRSDSRWRD